MYKQIHREQVKLLTSELKALDDKWSYDKQVCVWLRLVGSLKL